MFGLKFPREVSTTGRPRRKVVMTKKQYISFINSNNGITNLFTNVYNAPIKEEKVGFYKMDYSRAILDKIYLDCDKKIKLTNGEEINRPNDGYDDLIKIHKWCEKNDYINYPFLTGNGYNIYIATDTNDFIKNERETIYNAQTFIEKELDIITDFRVKGQTERVSRIPFTLNMKAKRYSIPLTADIIYLGNEKIKELAQDKEFVKTLYNKSNKYGAKLWSIKQFDRIRIQDTNGLLTAGDTSFQLKDIVDDLKNVKIPICIQKLLSNPDMRYDERRIVIVWLKEIGFSRKEVESILKKYLSPKKWKHMMEEEVIGGMVKYIFDRDKVSPLFFENFETMRIKGLCPFLTKGECGLHIDYDE